MRIALKLILAFFIAYGAQSALSRVTFYLGCVVACHSSDSKQLNERGAQYQRDHGLFYVSHVSTPPAETD